MISGDLLIEARRRAGISQAELARRSGVATSLIGRYERYEVIPSFERLRELVRACGLDLSFRLANADAEGHDMSLIERALELTAAERVTEAVGAGRAVENLWSRSERRHT